MGSQAGRDGFTSQVFAQLGRAETAGDAVTCVERLVDPMIARINRSMWASRFSALRSSFGLSSGDAFLSAGNYLHGSPRHWYIFHRGGRWEPQFNIGMFSVRPDVPQSPYLRIGIGFGLSLDSADPDRENGLRNLRSFFGNAQALARSRRHEVLDDALSLGWPLVECVGLPPERSADPERVARWLGALDAHAVRWVFLGRILSPQVPEEAGILADRGDLLFEITRTLDVGLPVWEAIMRGHD